MVANPVLDTLQCVELHSNKRRCVAIQQGALDDFDAVEERKKARLLRIIELWCDDQRLTEEQFNGNEGREQKGNISVLIQAFKTHKIRLYGVDVQIASKRTFVIVEIDGAKKQNKADPKILKRAKAKALKLLEDLDNVAKLVGLAEKKR